MYLYGKRGNEPATPPSSPTSGSWRPLQFSYSSGNAYGQSSAGHFPTVQVRLRQLTGQSVVDPWNLSTPVQGGFWAAAHGGNDLKVYVATSVAKVLLVVCHAIHPENFPASPATGLPVVCAELDMAPYSAASELNVVIGAFTGSALALTVDGSAVSVAASTL